MSLPVLTALTWVPGFAYEDCGTPITFDLSIPQLPWTYMSRAKGGWDTAASGVQASFITRHDRIYSLHLRVTEEEFVEKVEPMVKILWMQPQILTVSLDIAVPATDELVRLENPVPTAELSPSQGEEFFGVLQVDLDVRTEDGTAFSYPYHPSLK